MAKISLAKIWHNRKQILEGTFNLAKKNEFVEEVSAYRMAICNTCTYKSASEGCGIPGTGPCCSACGCSLKIKTRSLSSACGAIEKDEPPKWLPVMSPKQENILEQKEKEEK
jgi:hypothetical protein